MRTVAGWEILACKACGFTYTPRVRQSTATELDLPAGYVPIWRARHRQIYRLLEDRLAPGDLIVDVGAGFAELGRIVQAAGRYRYVGFEPSNSIARHAAARGIAVRPELFTSTSLREPASAVVLDNVIEHVADPRALLRACTEALRPGGVLVVIVPNRHDVRQLIPSWRDREHWIPPEHINYFTASSLAWAMQCAGVRPHPFGFAALGVRDIKYWPRALLELVRVYPFGLNMYGVKSASR
ncbi:class I SAM-dependent methyltransferase [Variovorax paradoxus]|nr:class I SAM-dependent methyltransferase [Variovorax paradoxus]MBT2300804.1 class I SAM-dependent methyltransferase [Variovorax paradoxus]